MKKKFKKNLLNYNMILRRIMSSENGYSRERKIKKFHKNQKKIFHRNQKKKFLQNLTLKNIKKKWMKLIKLFQT